MRRRLLVIVLPVFAVTAKGQSGQIKAYLEQIAAYEVYIKDAEKGYAIAESGIHSVHDIKNGTFNLHTVFFSSLKTVSPTVGNFAVVAQILALQVQTVTEFQTAIQSLKLSGGLNPDELAYVGNVYSGVIDAGIEDVSVLTEIVTSGPFSMNDGERLHSIDRIYSDVRKRYQFSRAFAMQCVALDRSRHADEGDIGTVRSLYGIK